ncbi:MAG: Lrp/AsnC family transcriptional regulator [Sulfolobales archaeon]
MYRESLDELDLRILEILRENARISIRDIARLLRRAPSTVAERIKKLEKKGFIIGYTALIDSSKLGYRLNALTLLQVEGGYIEEVEKLLASEPNVRAVYDITGEYDIAIVSTFRDTEELDKFIKRILKNPHIKRSVTNVILRIVKEKPSIPISHEA